MTAAPGRARPGAATPATVVDLTGVSVVRDGSPVLAGVDWRVRRGERWVIAGPNGSGKTTLLQVAGARLLPTRGRAEVLGQRLGAVDLRALRERIAFVSGSLGRQLRPDVTAREVVVTGLHGALEPWWHSYGPPDWRRAEELLGGAGLAGAAGRRWGVLSEGERQEVLLCRALITDPALVLLDEPAAGLDLGARERLVARLAALAADPGVPAVVLVTHHLEEVPPGYSNGALVASGQVVATGAIDDVFTSRAISACFGVAVDVGRHDGRWWARAVSAPEPALRTSSAEKSLSP